MPKKDFKNNPALAFIGTQQTHGTGETQEPQSTQGTLPAPAHYDAAAFANVQKRPGLGFPENDPIASVPSEPKYYRLNLKLKAEYKDYLERVSWESHKSITQYLNDLIEADKDARDI